MGEVLRLLVMLLIGAAIGITLYFIWEELDDRRRWYKMFGTWRNRQWREEHTIPLKGGRR